MRHYLEYSDRSSAKFWEIRNEGKFFTVRWGKIGAEGQTKTNEFTSAEEARKEAEKLLVEKLKKGYTEKDLSPDAGISEKKVQTLNHSMPRIGKEKLEQLLETFFRQLENGSQLEKTEKEIIKILPKFPADFNRDHFTKFVHSCSSYMAYKMMTDLPRDIQGLYREILVEKTWISPEEQLAGELITGLDSPDSVDLKAFLDYLYSLKAFPDQKSHFEKLSSIAVPGLIRYLDKILSAFSLENAPGFYTRFLEPEVYFIRYGAFILYLCTVADQYSLEILRREIGKVKRMDILEFIAKLLRKNKEVPELKALVKLVENFYPDINIKETLKSLRDNLGLPDTYKISRLNFEIKVYDSDDYLDKQNLIRLNYLARGGYLWSVYVETPNGVFEADNTGIRENSLQLTGILDGTKPWEIVRALAAEADLQFRWDKAHIWAEDAYLVSVLKAKLNDNEIPVKKRGEAKANEDLAKYLAQPGNIYGSVLEDAAIAVLRSIPKNTETDLLLRTMQKFTGAYLPKYAHKIPLSFIPILKEAVEFFVRDEPGRIIPLYYYHNLSRDFSVPGEYEKFLASSKLLTYVDSLSKMPSSRKEFERLDKYVGSDVPENLVSFLETYSVPDSLTLDLVTSPWFFNPVGMIVYSCFLYILMKFKPKGFQETILNQIRRISDPLEIKRILSIAKLFGQEPQGKELYAEGLEILKEKEVNN